MTIKTTVFILTIDDPALPLCVKAIQDQIYKNFTFDYIRSVRPFNAAMQVAIDRCKTEYFIQVDEDMILYPNAVKDMQYSMDMAPDGVGMLCFHLYDEDRAQNIQGIKIYRAACFKNLKANDVLTSEMDLLEQLDRTGVKWILCPEVMGRHGVLYTPESIYLRYKSMYQKDIKAWNTVTLDIRRKAEIFRQTGDSLQLFALLGAIHGIIEAPRAEDKEIKDYAGYNLKELELYKKLFLENSPYPFPYDENTVLVKQFCQPYPYEKVQWKSGGPYVVEKQVKILIACTHFWPCVGGVEAIVADLGAHLAFRGHKVTVATLPNPERTTDFYRGVQILSLGTAGTAYFEPEWPFHLQRLIESGHYDACILISNPTTPLIWAANSTNIPEHTRILIQPIINADDFNQWKSDHKFIRELSNLLKRSTTVALTLRGVDHQFFTDEGIVTSYIPNAVDMVPAEPGFRKKFGITEDKFVVVHIANLYRVKNHLGLIDALTTSPSEVQLVLIGHPVGERDYVEEILSRLKKNPQIIYIAGLPPEGVRQAINEADLLVLSSHGEVSPVSVLEAMSQRKPWLATPACGTVNEIAGGVVAPLERFAEIISYLKNNPDICTELGMLGYLHWKACFTWQHVVTAWEELIAFGSLSHTFEMQDHLVQKMSKVLDRIDKTARQETGEQPLYSDLSSSKENAVTPQTESGPTYCYSLVELTKTGRYDTDKAGYMTVYDKLFRDVRFEQITLFEIGIFKGGSLKLWRDYFPSGKIVGMDINAVDFTDDSGRVKIYQGSQDDIQLLSIIAYEQSPAGFDIIIDDASHVGSLTKLTFWHLFDNHLKAGGTYIIEDWGTGYWPDFPDGQLYLPEKPHTAGMVGFVKELIDEVASGDVLKPGFAAKMVSHAGVASVEFLPGMVVVKKAGATQ